MKEVTCHICEVHISNWMMASGKTKVINGNLYHKSCLIDFQLRHGEDYDKERNK